MDLVLVEEVISTQEFMDFWLSRGIAVALEPPVVLYNSELMDYTIKEIKELYRIKRKGGK